MENLQRPSEALSTPKHIKLSENLVGVCFDVMKIIPAKHIMKNALEKKIIDQNSLIVESSSGNFASGLAVVCKEYGLQLHIVGDPAIDKNSQVLLKNLGVNVDIIQEPDEHGAYQRLRLNRVNQVLKDNPGSFWPKQYDNPDNPEAYKSFAEKLLENCGDNLTLVASVGSGGSSVGTIRALRKLSRNVGLIGVDTYNSVLFGLPDGHRNVRGLGNSVVPKILDHTLFDMVHWMDGSAACSATRELYSSHGVFGGITTGAAYLVARHHAKQSPDHRFVFISPDNGHRYMDTAYNDEWMDSNNMYLPELSFPPVRVDSLDQVKQSQVWTMMDWSCSTLESQIANKLTMVM